MAAALTGLVPSARSLLLVCASLRPVLGVTAEPWKGFMPTAVTVPQVVWMLPMSCSPDQQVHERAHVSKGAATVTIILAMYVLPAVPIVSAQRVNVKRAL